MYLKKEDIFYFNIDELEVYGTFSNYIELLKGINNSNSDYIEFLDFILYKSDNLKDYHFKIDFMKGDIKCFAFYTGKKINNHIITRDYFKVYGNAFKILELYEIIDFINTYIELDYIDGKNKKKFNTLKRFDIAIDIKKNIKEILKNFKELKQKGSSYFGNNGEIETYYIGEYKKKLNKRLLIRIYDKIKDIKTKNKQKLYSNYLLEKNITRIELEFRTELTKHINLNSLLDRSYIFNLFIKYIEKHTNIFEKLKTQDVKKLKSLDKKIDLKDISINKILNKRYYSSFIGYGTKIKSIGVCPTNILIKNCLVNQYTIDYITNMVKNNNFNLKYLKKLNKCSKLKNKIKNDRRN